jgi:biopolymer transport protein ExbB
MFRYLLLFFVLLIFCCPLFAAVDTAGDDGNSLFGLFVVDGGPIVWYVLIPMSVAMMFVVAVLCFTLRRGSLLSDGIAGEIAIIAKVDKPAGLAEALSGRQDIVSKVISRVIAKSKHLDADKKYMHELSKEALHEQAVILLRKVEWCGIIGNVAPMVGLFGTVYGMIQAFNVLGVAGGQPRPDQLAAKISIALVTTFWGLLIAIPAIVIHGVFRSRIESVVGEAAVEVESVIGELFSEKVTK